MFLTGMRGALVLQLLGLICCVVDTPVEQRIVYEHLDYSNQELLVLLNTGRVKTTDFLSFTRYE